MEKKTLHVFNPEHDLALAVGAGPYTPPAEVVRIQKECALLPALYARNSDFILLPVDMEPHEINSLKYFGKTAEKNLTPVNPSQLYSVIDKIKEIQPWGWDHAVRDRLIAAGTPKGLLPSQNTLDKIRELSHRRTSILLREAIAEIMGEPVRLPAKELFSVTETEEFLQQYLVAYLKAPWSSSGRGIIKSDHIKPKGMLEWAHGTIRKQGSLIAEPAWDRIFDFATEWFIRNEEVKFIGYSVFETSSRGKYHGNVSATQDALLKMIIDNAPSFSNELIQAQEESLRRLIAPFYSGPLGIDMLADSDGYINPCVEINLRMTMGFVQIAENMNF